MRIQLQPTTRPRNRPGRTPEQNDIISSCVTSYTGADLVNGFGDSVGTLSGQEAQDYCDRAWSRLTFWDFGWLIVAVVFGVSVNGLLWTFPDVFRGWTIWEEFVFREILGWEDLLVFMMGSVGEVETEKLA